MKYLYDVPFSTPAATDSYRSGWEAVFGKKPGTVTLASVDRDAPTITCDPAPFVALLPGDDCPCASGKAFAKCHGYEDDQRDE